MIKSENHGDAYTNFTVLKPKWSEGSLVEYQNETNKNLKYLFKEFDQPEHIPVLTQLCSEMLVLSGEKILQTHQSNSHDNTHAKKTFYSLERRQAYSIHKSICKEWRKEGRPSDISHPKRQPSLPPNIIFNRLHEKKRKRRQRK